MAGEATPQIGDGPMAWAPTSRRQRRTRRAWSIFLAYCLIQTVLTAFAWTMPFPASGLVSLAVVAAGTTALVTAIVRRRPSRTAGWWLLAAGATALLAAHIVTGAIDGLTATATVVTVPGVPVALASIPLLGAGLALLGRRPGTAGIMDALDASMVAAAVLLLAWLAVTNSVTPSRSGLTIAAFVLPFGVIAVFGSAVKLVMSGGVSTGPLVLVVAAVATLIGSTMLVLLTAVHDATVAGTRDSKALWAASGALLGGAGLHPSFNRAIRHQRPSETDLSAWRIIVFACITVLVPLALAVDLLNRSTTFDHTLAGVAGPTAAAIALLLLLLARLAVTARISHRQAAVLRQRTGALTLAVEQQRKLQQELTYRATHDPLTALANRIMLADRLKQVLARDRSGATIGALLMVDLDGFKDVNDTYGHPTGDQLLAAVADRLRAITPPGGLIARVGGDEFAMLLEVTGAAEATAVGHAILGTLRPPLRVDGQELFISASIGLLVIDAALGAISPSDALRDADLSLYAAKSAGKNRIARFTEQLRAQRMETASIAAGLRHALTHDDITLHYQPVIDLDTGATVALEALARWHPVGGASVPPDRFIPVAEAAGMINALGEHLIRTACSVGSSWYADWGVAVTVNISGQQLKDPGFTDIVNRALTDYGLAADGLILELTESSLIDTAPDCGEHAHLRMLQAAGVRIAIDDFGTGYSSLSYLSDLPVDIVKIDQAFAHRASGGDATTEQNWAYTGAILHLIASLGLTAITEGVETAEQDRALRRLGCRYAQGYLYARPQSADDIDRVLAAGGRARSSPGGLRRP